MEDRTLKGENKMRKKTQTTYYAIEDKQFKFLVIPYKDIDGSLSIRGTDLDVSLNCTAEQATQLINELQKAVLFVSLKEGEEKNDTKRT